MLSPLKHFDCDGDGVELVVVGGVGEGCYFFEEGVDPGSSDEDDLAFFGEVGPGEGSGELVAFDLYAAKGAAEETVLSSQFLNEGHAVERLFDPVFGVAFVSYLLCDESFLFRELDAFSESIGDVEVAGLFIKSTTETGGEVG